MMDNMDNRAAEDNTLSLKKSGLPAVSHSGRGLLVSGGMRREVRFKEDKRGI
jgi:hypothetical protein